MMLRCQCSRTLLSFASRIVYSTTPLPRTFCLQRLFHQTVVSHSARLKARNGDRHSYANQVNLRNFSETRAQERRNPGKPEPVAVSKPAKTARYMDETPMKELPYYKFAELVQGECQFIAKKSRRAESILEEYGLTSEKQRLCASFRNEIMSQPASSYADIEPSGRDAQMWQPRADIPSLNDLKQALETGGTKMLGTVLLTQFELFVSMQSFSREEIDVQKQLADLKRPADWYPLARSIPRELHLHVGPTNSGKTFHALQRLKQATSGTFAGPLRLLAYEVYERLNKEGIKCNLSTGEERRIEDGVQLLSSTIEMLNLSTEIDVLVIDEIQMIADPERGAAWTAALLGAPAKEIHMCGEASVVDLIEKIAESMGETVTVHHYNRLGGLEPLKESLDGTFRGIEAGDAVVTFSRNDIFNVKKLIEQSTGMKCAVVYGALPPETRSQQAALFNDPDSEYSVIVASDAIGMGLNLSIKRVVFETLQKYNGERMIKLPIPQVKQIAGRAGRFKPKAVINVNESDPPKDVPGYVTTLRPGDLPYLQEALATPTLQLEKAVLRPPIDLIESFCMPYKPGQRMSLIMRHFKALAQLSDLYALQNPTGGNELLDLLHPITSLSINDRIKLTDSPLKTRIPECVASFLELAKALGESKVAEILDLKKMDIDLLDEGLPETPEGLKKIESLHHQLTMYAWLNMRYPGVFPSLEDVVQLRFTTEEFIRQALDSIRAKKRAARRGLKEGEFVNSAMSFERRKSNVSRYVSSIAERSNKPLGKSLREDGNLKKRPARSERLQ